MMKNFSETHIKIISLIILIFLQLSSFTQTIEGHIRGLNNKELSHAHIRIHSLEKATISNDSGYFNLRIDSAGIFDLSVSYIGYSDTIISLNLSLDENKYLIIQMNPMTFMLETAFITASRHEQIQEEIPSRIESINKERIETAPFNNTDEFLLLVPGIHTDRDFGIFSRNAGVTMRGLNSTARVLVLHNGTPINKADGGGINWNRINPEQIERIEIVKGPASTIYGGNAMSGIINIITPKPDKRLSGSIKAGLGSYKTYSLNTHLSGNEIKNDKGFYWSLNNFLREGDGYLVNTADLTTEYDTTVFLKELGINGLIGYQLNKNSEIELDYNFWDDIRSDGVKVFEELGSYSKFTTHALKMNYKQNIGVSVLRIQPYYQSENYFRQNESVGKKNNKYRYYNTFSDREDYGILTSLSRSLSENLLLTTGIDVKLGRVYSTEMYYTSTDVTKKTGQLNQYAIYALGQNKFMRNKLSISLGLRFDYIEFKNGSFEVETPSSLTDFIENYPIDFTDENWSAISPKASAKYQFSHNFSTYLSYAVGYRPPMLDDMCTNRSVTKGFKIANTKLAPEYLYNYEGGLNWSISKNILLETSIYHSIGKGFHYFVGIGDSIDAGGEDLKPVLIRDNIAEVKVYGIENSVSFHIISNLLLNMNHAYNYSFISNFSNDKYANKDLEGKFLMEVPAHNFNATLMYLTKYINTALSFQYIDKQWVDDENTTWTPSYNYVNLKFTSQPFKFLKTGLNIQNVLNKQYVNNKGQLCPGRFILFDIQYIF
ncbi:MAG: TonB-dependent receptor [Bacteroidales bacterium]|nr:TonB-dependent receptor [Bacteroidales bacterium]